MNKNEICDFVRNQIGNQRMQFPAAIDFQEDGRNITLSMAGGATQNMQGDAAAFEGWALCIKTIMDISGCNYTFTLDWDGKPDPKDPEYQHYQRFLYRVYKFDKLFGGKCGWFRVHKPERINELRINFCSKPGHYKLNVPMHKRNVIPPRNKNGERFLEYRFIEVDNYRDELMKAAGIEGGVLGNQLPVGLFERNVAQDSAIFSGKASAIDLWGVKNGKLCIFELKKPGNKKVGAVSELFFYAMVMSDIVRGVFAFEGKNKRKIETWPPDHIRFGDIEDIEAIFLMKEMHPLVTPAVLKFINKSLASVRISFRHLWLNGWAKTE